MPLCTWAPRSARKREYDGKPDVFDSKCQLVHQPCDSCQCRITHMGSVCLHATQCIATPVYIRAYITCLHHKHLTYAHLHCVQSLATVAVSCLFCHLHHHVPCYCIPVHTDISPQIFLFMLLCACICREMALQLLP